MLKNKFKIIALLSIIILALTLPIVRAENETADNTANADVTTTEANNMNSETPQNITDENFKKNDVYLTGDNVTVDYIVDGNLFVFANHVTINAQIGGDAFIFANTVTVEKQGYVFSNLFTFSKDVTINGVVYDLYAACENTTINGYVYRDIRVGSNNVNIFGTVGRNAYIDCANLNLSQDTNANNEEKTETNSHGVISGNLNYSAKQEASIPEGSVMGEIAFKQETHANETTLQNYILSLGTFLATVIIIWLLCLWLTPKFLDKTVNFVTTKKILPVIGFGILTPFVGILLAILLFILGITSTIGLLLLITLFVLIAISTAIFVITINNLVCHKLKVEKTIGKFGILIASAIILWLVSLIPYVGSIIGMVAIVIGLGIILSSLLLKDKKQADSKVEETK